MAAEFYKAITLNMLADRLEDLMHGRLEEIAAGTTEPRGTFDLSRHDPILRNLVALKDALSRDDQPNARSQIDELRQRLSTEEGANPLRDVLELRVVGHGGTRVRKELQRIGVVDERAMAAVVIGDLPAIERSFPVSPTKKVAAYVHAFAFLLRV